MQTVRAIVIPANAEEPIHEIGLTGNPSDGYLDALQALVGGLIEAVPWSGAPDDVTLYVNEEGKFDQDANPRNDRATRMLRPGTGLFLGDWIAGALVIAGLDRRTGETVSLSDDVDVSVVEEWCGREVRA